MSGISLIGLIWAASFLVAAAGLLFSADPLLWALGSLALPIAVWAAGRAGEKPIVIAHLGLFWAAVVGGLLARELKGQLVDEYETQAIVLSLAALVVIAFGYRAGFGLFRQKDLSSDVRLSRHKLLIAYWVAFGGCSSLEIVAWLIPELTQPILALNGIKLLLLYLLCAQTFRDRAGLIWLAPVILAEFVTGAIGYIASYQVPLLVIFAASLNAQRGSVSWRQLGAGAMAIALLLWASVVWTAIKPEFRAWLAISTPAETESGLDRLNWINQRLAHGVDYEEALAGLVNRIGYTELYSNAIPRIQSVRSDFWLSAIVNVLTPRLLFPDKAGLDDTRITSELTGRQFGRNTSVSIGYVAQAHADFGFPGMYAALYLVGLALGAVGGYFQTRDCAQIARDGFMTAALVFKFAYENNVDKAIGGLILSSLALFLVFRFAYRPFEKWAAANGPRHRYETHARTTNGRMRGL